ncbi:hypothetical protein [Streptomyces decoyicus]
MPGTNTLQTCWDEHLLGTPTGRRLSIDLAERLDAGMSIGPYRHPEGPVPIRPVLITSERGRELEEASIRLLDLVDRTCRAHASSVAELADRVGYIRPTVSLLSDNPAQNCAVLGMARPDVVISGGAPKFVECNIDSAIAGPEQIASLNGFFRDTVRSTGWEWLDDERVGIPDSLRARSQLVVDSAKARGVDRPEVRVLGWSAEGFGSERYFSDVISDLAGRGVSCEFALPGDLDFSTFLTHQGRRVDFVLRMFTTGDAAEDGLDLTPLALSTETDTALTLSPELGTLYTSKRILAWLSESADELSSADREFVDTYLAWTRVVSDTEVTWKGDRVGLLKLLRTNRHGFLLKPFDQRGGAGCVVGRDVEESEWEEALESAVANGRYVAQEFWPPDPINVPVFHHADGEVRSISAAAVFSPIIFGRRLSGVLVRHTNVSTTSVVNGVRGGVMNTAWTVSS